MSLSRGSKAKEVFENAKSSEKRVTRSSKRASEVPTENIPVNLPRKKTKKADAVTSGNKNSQTDTTNTNNTKVVKSVAKSRGRGRGKGRGKQTTTTTQPRKRTQPHYWAKSPPTREQWLAIHPDSAPKTRGRGRGRGRGSSTKSKGPRVYYWADKKLGATMAAEHAVANLYDSD